MLTKSLSFQIRSYKRTLKAILPAAALTLLVIACNANQESSQKQRDIVLPAALEKLKEKGLVIVDTFTTPGGLVGWAGYMEDQAMSFYVTPDGKYVIAGTLLDSTGRDINREVISQTLSSAVLGNVWEQLEKANWIKDGENTAPRTVYVFTDVNCGYCSKFLIDSRPWVESGKVQLRHIMVGIISETSPAKAAAVLSSDEPDHRLLQHARYVRSGRQPHLQKNDIQALDDIPLEIVEKLEANHRLMGALRLRATPSIVWKDESGAVKIQQGMSEEALISAFGPR